MALKVLPETFASDPYRLARFQREAEVLASLNHPNIDNSYRSNFWTIRAGPGQTLLGNQKFGISDRNCLARLHKVRTVVFFLNVGWVNRRRSDTDILTLSCRESSFHGPHPKTGMYC